MSLGRVLRSSFSPHEISIMGIAMTYAFGGIALAAMFMGSIGFGIILLLVGVVIEITFHELSRCSGCGKSPKVRYHIDLGWCELPMWRLWPERECSSCGARLTGPEQN